jgi:hypothetical protein
VTLQDTFRLSLTAPNERDCVNENRNIFKKGATQILNQAYKKHVGFKVLAAVDMKNCPLGYHAV